MTDRNDTAANTSTAADETLATEAGIRAEEARDRRFVTALARGLAILRSFKRSERWLANSEIASRTGLPRPTVSRLTYTLTRLGYLEHSQKLEKYALGASVLALGHAFLAGEDVRAVAKPLMQALADEVQASVILGALDQTQMVVLEVCHGSNAFHIRREIGERLPHGTTALGRAYLAGLDRTRYDATMATLLQRVPKAKRAEVSAGVEQARHDYAAHGFVFSLGDWMPELYAVGVPLPIQGGERLLALSVNGPVYSMTRERLVGEVGPALRRARDAILQRVG
jgi:DNA-binding IclR family transcriptional regulator